MCLFQCCLIFGYPFLCSTCAFPVSNQSIDLVSWASTRNIVFQNRSTSRLRFTNSLLSGKNTGNNPRIQIVIDWGFTPQHVNAVRKLFDADVMLRWFAADWAVARRNFEQRRYPMCKYFDIQIRKSRLRFQRSMHSFARTWSMRYPPRGIYTPPDQIRESMLDTLADSAETY